MHGFNSDIMVRCQDIACQYLIYTYTKDLNKLCLINGLPQVGISGLPPGFDSYIG